MDVFRPAASRTEAQASMIHGMRRILRAADLLFETPVAPEQIGLLAEIRSGAQLLEAAAQSLFGCEAESERPAAPAPRAAAPGRAETGRDGLCRIVLWEGRPPCGAAVRRYLFGRPYEIAAVTTAQQALEAWRGPWCDVLFAVIGPDQNERVEALRALRACERGGGRPGPIVALAGSRMNPPSGEIECEAQVAIPLHKDELLQALERCGQLRPVEPRVRSLSPPEPVAPAMRAVVNRFLEIQRAELAQAQQRLERLDVEGLGPFAGHLAGTAESLGLHPLAVAAMKLAHASRRRDRSAAARSLELIRHYLDIRHQAHFQSA